jgi:iron complex outermembrane receptor protein
LTYEQQQWSSSALWRVVCRQPRVAMNEGNVVGKDFATSAGFGVLSANVGYKVNQAIKVSGGIDNILNKAYSEHLNLAGNSSFGYSADMPVNEPGRTLWVKLNMKF